MESDYGDDDGLVKQLNRMIQWNNQLNREKFDLEHRVRNLIMQLGYHSLEHAEESQREQSQAQTGIGTNSELALQARLDTALAKIEVLEGAAASSFHRHQRELDLLERDVKRLSNEKTTLEQRITLSDSLLLYTKEEAQRMRDEFDQRLAIKEDIISELRSKMPLVSSNPPEALSRSKENGLLMEIDMPLLPHPESDLPKVLHRLEFHHKELKTKYDVLLDEKRALARRFSNHIKQWKRFKVWYHTKYDAGDIDVSQLSTSAKKQHYRRLRDTHDEQGRTLPIIVTDLIHSAETDLSRSLPNSTSTSSAEPSSSTTTLANYVSPNSPLPASHPLQPSCEPQSPIQPAMRSFDFDFDSLLPQPRGYPLSVRHPTESSMESTSRVIPVLSIKTSPDNLIINSTEASSSATQANPVPSSLSKSSVERKNITLAQSSTPASVSASDAITATRTTTPKISTPTAFPSDLTSEPEHKGALKSRLGLLSIEGNLTSLTPKTRSELPANLKRPRANEPISEPRPAQKRRVSKTVLDDSTAEGEDCLETDTEEPMGRPSNTTVRTTKNNSRTRPDIERCHSSPPDTPHRASKTRSIEERAATLRREATSDGIGLGKDNPFTGPSRPEAQIMTKEEREAHFKQLRSKPYAEYKKAYAAYKGHGRYGQRPTGEDDDDDINAAYELDETRNDGMNRPFDEVVRDKEARQRLHGIDCPCCKAYYEAVGPVPPRLKAPLWKSPTPGQSQPQSPQARRHRSASPVTPSKSRTKAIADHRQHISRHRHKWIPPATPPDYWTIGFPDTQQTKDINQCAREIRAAKMKRLEEDSSKADGRYRKKR